MKKKTKKTRVEKIDWLQIVQLSAAGKYIQDRLDEELKKININEKKRI